MADETQPGADVSDVTILQLSTSCLHLFQNLLEKLTNDTDDNKLQGDRGKAWEEYGRLKVWCDENGAALPPQDKGSLENLLRHEEKLRETVLDIFKQMEMFLHLAISSSLELHELSRGRDWSSIDSPSSESDESSSEGGRESSTKQIYSSQERPRIFLYTARVFSKVALLYSLSNLLHRPGLRKRHIQLGLQNSTQSAPSNHSEVWHKLNAWQEPSQQESRTEEKIGAHLRIRHSVEDSSSSVVDILSERLIRADVRRRQQLSYCSRHTSDSTQEAESITTASTTVVMPRGIRTRPKKGGKTLPSSEELRKVTTHVRTMAGSKRKLPHISEDSTQIPLGVPEPPITTEGDQHFHCPYCGLNLQIAMWKHPYWEQHIFGDLQPYVCTFNDCSCPEKMYPTRQDWIYHEMQVHRRQWNCKYCRQTFFSQSLMTQHLEAIHRGIWEYDKLPRILELCESSMDDSEVQHCPLCPIELAVDELMTHLAKHMEELALLALPSRCEETESNSTDEADLSTRISSTQSSDPQVHRAPVVMDARSDQASARGSHSNPRGSRTSRITESLGISRGSSSISSNISSWRWNCCVCGHGNNSYTHQVSCPSCYRTRCGGCSIYAFG
ncbi:hypothetical protein F5B20DRAFT_566434 [Whalleya microplaca]|nr:hypothetical protein F5B20DRAFT_566434 [Whalleya microplaca]